MIDMGNREVLAPAGTYECFRAAINAGADAVYLGGSMFGARAFAGNFEEAYKGYPHSTLVWQEGVSNGKHSFKK